MCGIAGFIGKKRKSTYIDSIKAMCDQMVYRGPNGDGYWYEDETQMALGHRRLSIIDLSENGKQPMLSASGRYVITYNGEIYNFKEIRKSIEKTGKMIAYRGSSDTEVLIEAFETFGINETLNLIRGMFAIALYDRVEKMLYLIRDRMGEKPLYYGWNKGDFVFASNLDAIRAYTGEMDIDPHALLQFLCYGYIPGTLSIYKDIYKLLPGEILKLDVCDKTVVYKQKYWDVLKVSNQKKTEKNEEELSEDLESILSSVIKEQMVADVPIGAYLSGGVDSSLVVALMQKQSADQVRTYTIGIEGEKGDEAPWSQKVADALGVKHTTQYITKDNMLNSMLEMGKVFSEPYADVSQVPTYMVSKLARQDVTVTLSGDGGDELFCGYTHYEKYPQILDRMKRSPKYNVLTYLVACGGLLLPRNKYTDRLMDFKTKYGVSSPEQLYRSICEAHAYGNSIVSGAHLKEMKNDDVPLQRYKNNSLDDYDNLMMVDQLQYLPDDILVKVDCTGMAVSLENRIPLLDKQVVEFAWSIPSYHKYDGVTTKKIMRNVLYKYVPRELIERPKQGFSFPGLGWLLAKQDMYNWITAIYEKRITGKNILNKKVTDILWKEYLRNKSGKHIMWNLVMLLIWAEERNIYL